MICTVTSSLLPVAAYGQEAAKDQFYPEANVQNAVTYLDRGNSKQKRGDIDGAMADHNQAIKFNPNYALAYNNRGIIKRTKGDIDGAIADFDRAITLNPKYAIAYRNRGNAKQRKGDNNGAIADFNRAITLGSQRADIDLTPN